MSLTPETVQKVAHLARIHLEEADVATLNTQMSRIMDMVDQLEEADTSQVEPMAHPRDLTQRERIDSVTDAGDQALQTLSDNVTAGVYLVPQLIDNP